MDTHTHVKCICVKCIRMHVGTQVAHVNKHPHPETHIHVDAQMDTSTTTWAHLLYPSHRCTSQSSQASKESKTALALEQSPNRCITKRRDKDILQQHSRVLLQLLEGVHITMMKVYTPQSSHSHKPLPSRGWGTLGLFKCDVFSGRNYGASECHLCHLEGLLFCAKGWSE